MGRSENTEDAIRGVYIPPNGQPHPSTPAPPAPRRRSLSSLIVIAILALVVVALVRVHRLHSDSFIILGLLIPSVVLHELSHGAMAYACGDDTARRAGRLTLNPIRHLDPFGSFALPVLMVLAGHGAFGWAKPVPVDIGKLRHPRNQAIIVGLVGPITNIVIALLMAALFRSLASPGLRYTLAHTPGSIPASLGLEVIFLGGYVNVLLAAFNLIPIPPLDGSALLERILPASALAVYYRFRTAMILVVFALVFLAPSVLGTVFSHALNMWSRLIS